MGNFARTNAEFPTNAVRGFLVITVKLAVEHRAKGDKTRLRPELLELVQPALYCAKFAIPQFQIFRPFSARCVPPFSDMAEMRLELGNALRYALCCGRFRLRAEKRVLRLGFRYYQPCRRGGGEGADYGAGTPSPRTAQRCPTAG